MLVSHHKMSQIALDFGLHGAARCKRILWMCHLGAKGGFAILDLLEGI